MSEGSKKRKRTDAVTEKRAKVRVLDKVGSGDNIPDAKTKGQSKQEKSERRSKKAAKGKKSRSTPSKEHPEILTADILQSQPDNLANGDDFISLSFGETEPATSKPSGKDARAAEREKKSKSKSKKPKLEQPSPQVEPAGEANSKSKQDRFILFIGNLPFTTTVAQIKTHFNALQPFTVRHSTEKTTGRSKGFAFLEFEGYDKMKTCLKLYHHSIFDPENQEVDDGGDPDESFTKRKKSIKSDKEDKPQSKHARRINVELTAGGGGKGKQRKEKIEQKNQKLSEERERRHVKEAAERAKAGQEKKARPATGANADEDAGDTRGNVHPSRLKRVGH